jgi:hypoxanthine phosphoribosyltransferase
LKVLFDEDAIRSGISVTARSIVERFGGEEITVLAILRGGIVFAADLIRELDIPVRLDTVGVSSYRGDATVPGELRIVSSPTLEVSGRRVLIVDDILDTGRTLARIRDDVIERGAALVATAVLLDKPARRRVSITPDFAVFTVPDVWVVGYGLDHDEKFRNLRFIAAI